MFDLAKWLLNWGIFLLKVTFQGFVLVIAGLFLFTIITSL